MQEQIQPFVISFLIGLLIGIDRERSLPRGLKGMGVRSFSLIALLGTLISVVNEPALTITISLFIITAILLNYHYTATVRSHNKALGITTGLAAAAVYVLGFLTPKQPALASVIGVAILVILLGRERLHSFAKEKLQPYEIKAATILVVIVISVMVLIPDRTIDPWHLFNPRRFGMLVAIIAAMQFTGYVAIRVFGDQLGMMFIGFFGGLVSSTAVFATLPSFIKSHPSRSRTASATAVLATVATLFEFSLVVFVAAPKLFIIVIKPTAVMMLVGVIIAISLYEREKLIAGLEPPKNPLDVKSVATLSLVIGVMIYIVALSKTYLGSQGVQVISFLGGLFELQSVSFAASTLFASGKLIMSHAANALYLALLASFVTKFVILFGFARNRFGMLTASLLTLMLGSGATVALIFH